MQAPVRDSDKDKSFEQASNLGAWVPRDPRRGRGSGGRGPEPAAALLPPDAGADRPMMKPSTRGQVAIDKHRRDWP
jgi:hypothetical protein